MMMNPGHWLRAVRLERGLTLEDVFAATRIRRVYLQAIEEENWERLPSPQHVRSYVRAYANFLHLNADEVVANLPSLGKTVSFAKEDETDARVWGTVPLPPVERPHSSGQTAFTETERPTEDLTPTETPEPLTGEWQQIFIEIGGMLRQRRELLGLTLSEIAHHTRIPKIYLHALEEGRFIQQNLTPMQTRGYLQQYASFLELDTEAVLLRFAEGLQHWRAARVQAESAQLAGKLRLPRFLRRIFSSDLWLVAGLLVAMIGLFSWWLGALESRRQAVSPTLPSISEVLLQTATPLATVNPTAVAVETLAEPVTALPLAEAATVTPTLAVLPTAVFENVQLTIAVSHRVWLRVLVDGEEVLRARAAPGAAYSFGGRERIELQTADASALQLIYNGRNLGVAGNPNEVLVLVFGPDGIASPTPTVSPTPTITFTPTRTPRPSATSRP